jgi:hypothetical protein
VNENTIRIKVGMSVSYIVGSQREDVIEYPRDEWEAMNSEEREAELGNLAQSYVADYLDSWAQIEGD